MPLHEIISLFCQLILLLLFASSVVQKLRDHIAYEQHVEGFAIVPAKWVAPLAWLATCAECLVVVLLLGGLFWNGMRLSGLLLALVLLFVFTGALISVVARGLQVHCGCFGADEHPVSTTSLIRNIGLIACCVLAALLPVTLTSSAQYLAQTILLTVPGAAAFVFLWINLDEITVTLRSKAVS